MFKGNYFELKDYFKVQILINFHCKEIFPYGLLYYKIEFSQKYSEMTCINNSRKRSTLYVQGNKARPLGS
jgi:hypothetical protein